LIQSFSALAPAYDLILCDVWGVVHNGLAAHPAAGDALTRFRAAGGLVVMVSNAPRPAAAVIAMLDQLGVVRSAYDAVVTSGDVTRDLISALPDRRVYHIGPDRDLPTFAGLDAERVSLEAATAAVCTGLMDDEHETAADYAETLSAMKARDLPMICANPDLLVERGARLIPCAGAIAAAYEAIGGRVIQAGKPHPPIYMRAFAEAERLRGRPVERRRCLAIGDAIRTDVAGAAAEGIDSLLCAYGIHWHDLAPAGRIDARALERFLADQTVRPTAVIDRLTW
jgi:HAD superfamily hydrolase (TIGR01459 family)